MDPILQELIDFISRMIANNTTHPDYKRTVKLAETYQALMTGTGVDKLLKRFIKRESPEDFKMRCDITQAITPAVIASIKNPFFKVARNERIKKGLKVSKKANEKKVLGMIETFYGSARSKNKGLDYWLKTRKFNLAFSDPNAWVVVEWKAVEETAVPKPYPFEVKSKNALNFEEVNDEIQWMFCDQDISFLVSKEVTVKPKAGKKFTFYGKDYTIVFERCDQTFLKTTDFELQANQQYLQVKSLDYIVSWYKPNVGYPPAFRIGYCPDLDTDSRTFVAPYHDAMPFLMKSLKAVSELDLTISGHVFPQKIQFAPPCPGEGKGKACDKGYMKDGSTCGTCRGTGYLTHEAANDVIYLAMPDVDAENIISLENILVYKSPPVEIVEFQNKYCQQLKGEAFEAVFNSQMFSKKTDGVNSTAQTAYEVDINMQSIYDTLEAYTEKDSELYREIVTVMAILCNEEAEKVDVIHIFPADFKLKTEEMLLADLKAANDSGAPSFLRDAISLDLAEIRFQGDELGLLKYKTKRRFYPFNGKSEDQIQLLMTSPYVAEREKILHANFDSIFMEIEMEHPEFYLLQDFDAQLDMLEEKLNEWTEDLKADNPAPSIKPLKDAAIAEEVTID